MRCCTRSLSALLCGVLLAGLLVFPAHAEGVSVNKVEVRLNDEGYQLSARYNIELNATVHQALSRGIPLYFVGEFSLTRPRWTWIDNMRRAVSRKFADYFGGEPSEPEHWTWLDKDLYGTEQTVKLSFNVLTRQYRISRGALFQNFTSFEEALNMLSRQSSAVIPAEMLDPDEEYIAAARLRLDIEQLPNLLQVNTLTGNDWTLDSGWYSWPVHPAEMAVRGEDEAE